MKKEASHEVTTQEPDIFQYLCYREYLNSFYNFKKIVNPKFSIRTFSRLCGMKSGNHIKLIMDKKRNLTLNHIHRVISVCGFIKKEVEYFLTLVEFNHAKDDKAKNFYLEKLKKISPRNTIAILRKSQTEILSKWFIVPLLEMVKLEGFCYDPYLIASQLQSGVTSKDVIAGYKLLEEVGLVKFHEGTPRQTNLSNFIGDGTSNELIQHYHAENIKMSIDPLYQVPAGHREYSSTTISITPQAFEKMKHRIQEIHEEFLVQSESIKEPTHLYQLNIQFFPILRKTKS